MNWLVSTNYNFRKSYRNNIPTRTKSKFITGSLSLSVFKSRYLQFFSVSPNSIYKIHNPVGLKYLTRLRVGLSHLKSHKFLHNFNDTPDQFCACDMKSIESTEHYLLFCPLYCPMQIRK